MDSFERLMGEWVLLGEMPRKDFDRDHAVQPGVARFVNLTLPTGANGGKDFVWARRSTVLPFACSGAM